MKYLLDTNAAHAYIFGNTQVKARFDNETRRGSKVGICFPVLCELIAGFERSDSRDRSMAMLHDALRILRVWPFTYEGTFTYGKLLADLINRGIDIGVMDVMIAATVIELKPCILVTSDGDFRWFDQFKVENWLT
jgi:predicted nucleic acid-binding protein